MSDTPILHFIATTARPIIDLEDSARLMNLKVDIEWGNRERIRAIQGHLSKAEDILIDLIWSIGTDEATVLANDIWPELATVID